MFVKIIKSPAVRKAVIALITAVAAALGYSQMGCGPSLQQLQAREQCYELAESQAQLRVDTECMEGFSSCASANEIMTELQLKQEACK